MSLFDKLDRTILRSMRMEHIVKQETNKNIDHIEIGTPGRKGVIKVYGDFNNPDEFKLKIEKAILIMEFANQKMNGGDVPKWPVYTT